MDVIEDDRAYFAEAVSRESLLKGKDQYG